MTKVLITYASAGDGHRKAAEALYESFLNSDYIHVKPVFVDALDYSTPFFGFGYKKAYEIMIKYMPCLWGFFYHILNNRFFFAIATPFRRLINGLNSRGLEEFILKEKFDLILSTHFFMPEVVSHLKEKGLSDVKLWTVVTDFRFHRFWIAKKTDRYFVASDKTKTDFIKMGVDNDKITVSGVPVGKKFISLALKDNARRHIGIEEKKFTILLMGGGLGVGPIERILLELQTLDMDCQIIAVCGRNKALVDKLTGLKKSFSKRVFIYGFSNNIDMFMASSDVIITKTGGITVSESLASSLPVIIINPIPGQEAGNADFLCDNGVGFRVEKPGQINNIILDIFESQDNIDRLKDRIRLLSKSHAARDILRLAMETAQ